MGVCVEVIALEQAFEVKWMYFRFYKCPDSSATLNFSRKPAHGILKQFLLYFDRLENIDVAVDSISYLDTPYLVLAERILR